MQEAGKHASNNQTATTWCQPLPGGRRAGGHARAPGRAHAISSAARSPDGATRGAFSHSCSQTSSSSPELGRALRCWPLSGAQLRATIAFDSMQNSAKRQRTEQQQAAAAATVAAAATTQPAEPAERHLVIVWDLDEVRMSCLPSASTRAARSCRCNDPSSQRRTCECRPSHCSLLTQPSLLSCPLDAPDLQLPHQRLMGGVPAAARRHRPAAPAGAAVGGRALGALR